MNLSELKETKLDNYVLSHLIRKNVAIGNDFDYQLNDIIYTHDNHDQHLYFREWAREAEINIKRILITNKHMNITKLIKMMKAEDDPQIKRNHLYDALKIEAEMYQLIYGED